MRFDSVKIVILLVYIATGVLFVRRVTISRSGRMAPNYSILFGFEENPSDCSQ